MKVLWINGSPHKEGDTAFLVSELKKHICGSWETIFVYDAEIQPCVDCRFCHENGYCCLKDDMGKIYKDDFDLVVISSPIYMSTLTGPLVSLASRFQAYYAAKRFLHRDLHLRPKKGVLILAGGGDGSPGGAISLAQWMFRSMNADFYVNDAILSLNTDKVPANQDTASIQKVKKIADDILEFGTDAVT